MKPFTGNFTQQEPLPDASIKAALNVMNSGRLHRYNRELDEVTETTRLEQEFADYVGVKYCLAVASGGYAMTAALRALDITHNEPVLTNGFTLAPVPGAIMAAGGRPVFVETTDRLVIDLNDLDAKIKSSNARILMLSHMRGHIVNMDYLMEICDRSSVLVIEDCAHTMGASWAGKTSGSQGVFGCYSTQTYKHMNSGEGGLLVSNDPALMARATMLSGSYMFFDDHLAGPNAEYFDEVKLTTPNCSGRMDNLRAAILRPQLANLDHQISRWDLLYAEMEQGLSVIPGVEIIKRSELESYVGSSIQFRMPEFSDIQIIKTLEDTGALGVQLKWFGLDEPQGFTSRYVSWKYVNTQALPETDRVLSTLLDMRLPLTFNVQDCQQICQIMAHVIAENLGQCKT